MDVSIPEPVLAGVEAALGEAAGGAVSVAGARAVSGGCINPSARIRDDRGRSWFLKWNVEHPGLFQPEAEGLRALARAAGEGPLRVPRVLGVGQGSGAPGWLLLEFVEEGRPGAGYGRELGRGLARLHRDRGDGWGWPADNVIGSLPQSNRPHPTWAGFWSRERLRPLLDRARQAGHRLGPSRSWDTLFERMDELVGPAEEEGPSLLHGDLWSGNVYPGPRGEPVLVDPAVYRGHREVDLAMTELFGGFPGGFRSAYEEAWPLAPGYHEGPRRALYQLYPLLVHVNLFGGGYAGRTRAALERALAG